RSENTLDLFEYTESSARHNALFSIEGLLLFAALESGETDTIRERARQFLAVRRLRQSEREPRFTTFDKGAESNEGLAEYAGTGAFLSIPRAVHEKKRAVPLAPLDARRYLLGKYTKLKSISQAGKNARLRFYYTGSAQALLLDRLLPDWKKKVQFDAMAVQDILAEAAKFAPAEAQALTDAALAGHRYEAVLKEQEALLAKKTAEAQALRDSMLNRKGRRFTLDVSGLGKLGDYRNFDPMNVTPVGKQTRVHTRTLKVADPGHWQ